MTWYYNVSQILIVCVEIVHGLMLSTQDIIRVCWDFYNKYKTKEADNCCSVSFIVLVIFEDWFYFANFDFRNSAVLNYRDYLYILLNVIHVRNVEIEDSNMG